MLKRLGLWQLVGAFLVGSIAFLMAGLHGGISSLIGSSAVWLGTFIAMFSMRRVGRGEKVGAGTALLLLLRAEIIKIALIALLLWVTFKIYTPGLVSPALIAGLAVAALLSGIGISRVNEELGITAKD